MDAADLSTALDRAERALARIERALEQSRSSGRNDEQLRSRVREAVAELDQLIRQAG